MSSALGIIFSYSQRENLREMTKLRTLSSVPFGGKYRIIDFILSNYVNSGINDVSIIARNNFHSLMDHVGSGKEWDMTRKRGGLRILSPLSNPGATDTGIYRGTLDAIAKNMHSIRRSMSEYVIISGCNVIYSLDYNDVIRSHIENNADITAVYADNVKENMILPCGVATLQMDGQNKVHEVGFVNEEEHQQNAFWCIGCFVIRKSLLESLVADAIAYGRYDLYRDILQRLAGSLRIIGYEYKKYLFEISSVSRYMQANMSLLKADVRKKVFEMPVYTKVKDSVPTFYSTDCHVSNSIIAEGCTIEGSVTNSILSRGVKIGKGTVINNSIIMQNTEIMKNVSLDHVILDKDVIVRESRQLAGHETYPVVIEKLSIV
jgi:glucose-1-phosphate adenylyltransferase, GlgD subunit